MPTGVGTALLISAAIGAGTSVAEGAIQSHQQSKAVDAEQKATNQAIAGLKPFQDTGTAAFQTLGSLMGLPSGGAAAASTPKLATTFGVTGPTAPPGMQGGAITGPGGPANSAQAAGGGYLGMTPGQAATVQTATSYPGYQPKTSPVPTVTMRGPDGSVAQIPADQVPVWQQKGAVVVHG